MNKKNYISAFSIVEAIVSMAIMAIILGITFFIFSIITERMIDFKNQNQLVNDFNRLTYSINKDIFDNDKMISSENQIKFRGYLGESINYYFTENYILRQKESFIDTFKIKSKNNYIDSVKNKSQKKIFLKLHLDVNTNEREMGLNFYKQVYPNDLLQMTKKE